MHVNPLRSFNLPDVGDYLIHFTGRSGKRVDEVPPTITSLNAAERLRAVLLSCKILAFPPFGAPLTASCFTESVVTSVFHLIGERRYTPHAVGFTKQFVFESNGGPVWYLRGDRWRAVHESLDEEQRSMTVRYWPGARPVESVPLPAELATESQWIHEREWRVLGDMSFSPANVAFVIVQERGWLTSLAWELDLAGRAQEASLWRRVPEVVIGGEGSLLYDGHGLFSRDSTS